MLSNTVVGLFLGLGIAAWIYQQAMRQTGNNVKNSLIVAGICGGSVFLVVMLFLSSFFH